MVAMVMMAVVPVMMVAMAEGEMERHRRAVVNWRWRNIDWRGGCNVNRRWRRHIHRSWLHVNGLLHDHVRRLHTHHRRRRYHRRGRNRVLNDDWRRLAHDNRLLHVRRRVNHCRSRLKRLGKQQARAHAGHHLSGSRPFAVARMGVWGESRASDGQSCNC